VKIPVCDRLAEDGRHSLKHVGELTCTNNNILYTVHVFVGIYIYFNYNQCTENIKNSVYCVSYTLWLCQQILLQTMQHITYISRVPENLHHWKLRTGIYFITVNLPLIIPASLPVRFSLWKSEIITKLPRLVILHADFNSSVFLPV